jgi:sterol desaturase/sphingolipid hydroxylase (fatty acid hydroxylase superfamily)
MNVFAVLRATRRVEPLSRAMPGWSSSALVGGTLAAVLWLERRRPLRRRTEREAKHETRNIAMAVISAFAIRVTEKPLTDRLTRLVHEKRWGILKAFGLPAILEVASAIVLLDYTLYLWHVLAHRVPFLWRFHRVHHLDVDLTATTALRFHFAELALSVPWRAAQIVVIGAAPLSLSLWQTATLVAVLFHHSNTRLPISLERRLCRVVMTPRMHGIHHSIVENETNSNWSTIFAWPDWVHGTYRLNVPQHAVTIGVPESREPATLCLARILAIPFERQPAYWQLPHQGKPERTDLPEKQRGTLAP